MSRWGKWRFPRLALLDTNVLIAFADPNDEWHGQATWVLEQDSYRWIVPTSTLIEAWNFLVGSRKKTSEAYALMNWLLTPGTVILLDEEVAGLGIPHYATQKFEIDIVDACLMNLADKLTSECALTPPVLIATYDTKDFLKCFNVAGFKYGIFDMRDLETIQA